MLNFFLRACIGYKKRSIADRSCWAGTKTVVFYSSESSLSQHTDLDSSCLICHLLLISDVKRKNTETPKNMSVPLNGQRRSLQHPPKLRAMVAAAPGAGRRHSVSGSLAGTAAASARTNRLLETVLAHGPEFEAEIERQLQKLPPPESYSLTRSSQVIARATAPR